MIRLGLLLAIFLLGMGVTLTPQGQLVLVSPAQAGELPAVWQRKVLR